MQLEERGAIVMELIDKRGAERLESEVRTFRQAIAMLDVIKSHHAEEWKKSSDDDSDWCIAPQRHIRWKNQSRFKVDHFDAESITIRIKPGDNGSAWTYVIKPPNSVPNLVVGRMMALWDGWSGEADRLPPAVVANGEKPKSKRRRRKKSTSEERSQAKKDRPAAAQPVNGSHTRALDTLGLDVPVDLSIALNQLAALQKAAAEHKELVEAVQLAEAARDEAKKLLDEADSELVVTREMLDSDNAGRSALQALETLQSVMKGVV